MSMKSALRAALLAALTAAAAALPAAANVQVGSSGWQWGNPLPQGNTLRAMSFAGTAGYAVGDFGTLLRTADGGATWSGLPVGTFQGLDVVQALDASTVFAGGGCVARRSVDGGRTFTAVAFAAVEASCRARLRDLSFVTRDVGYLLLEDGTVFATIDGGTRFAPRTAVPETRKAGGTAAPGGLAFLDARTGFATSGGTIFQTRDGGVSWRAVGGGGPALHRLRFLDGSYGFAVGQNGRLLRTDDGGATWNAKDAGAGGRDLTSIDCNGPGGICVITTANGTELVRTLGPDNRFVDVVTPSTDPVYAAAFAPPSPFRVVAGGASGTTVASGDSGGTFATIGGRLGGSYGAIRAGAAPGTAFAPGADGALAKTTDGGRTWTTGDVPTTAALLDVSFASAAVGYALDRDGGLFRTDDEGGSWQTVGTGSARRPRAVLAPDATVVLVVGPRGLRRSADGGRSFDQVRARAVLRAQLGAVAATRGGAIVAWGPGVVALSRDRGASWTRMALPAARGLRVQQVAFSSASAGLLLDTAGRVWRTTNGGRRWTVLPAVGASRPIGLAVSSARAAYLVVASFGGQAGGYLLRTQDGGATWQPQFVVKQGILPSGLATSADADYLLAGDASLLYSTTGGLAGEAAELSLATRARRLARPRRITVTGRLRPAAGSTQVTVSALLPSGRWTYQTVNVATDGTFASAWNVPRGTTTFVAQWAGDFRSAGAGSRTMTVMVAPRR